MPVDESGKPITASDMSDRADALRNRLIIAQNELSARTTDLRTVIAQRDAAIAKMNYCRQIIDADETHGEDRLPLSKMVHNFMVELDEYRDGEHEKIVALKAERDAAIAAREKAEADAAFFASELRYIAEANPREWDIEVRDQFQQWAQNRSRAALRISHPKGGSTNG